MDSRYGPGSDPDLHENVVSYSRPPVLSAHFIPAVDVSPPLSIWMQLYEIRSRVFGQILTQRKMREFDELPQMTDVGATSLELEYESLDHHDPLRCMDESIDALEEIVDRKEAESPVLRSVEIHNRNYAECGADLVQMFGTPFSDILGVLSRSDILVSGSSFDDHDEGSGSGHMMGGL